MLSFILNAAHTNTQSDEAAALAPAVHQAKWRITVLCFASIENSNW